MPAISVIVPVYRVEKYIHRCVDSILGQSFADFELILVDDGSPDSCGAICDEYAAQDSRVVVIHQENGGLSAARNAGIDWAFANSDSRWLTFIDSDDWVHQEYLRVLLDAAVSGGVRVSKCAYIPVDPQSPIPPFSGGEWRILPTQEAFLLKNSGVCAPAKLYARDSFRSIRFPVGKLHEDLFTTYKVLFQHESMAVVDQPLYYYWSNAEGITKSRWTPRRMDEFEAFGELLAFARTRKYGALFAKLTKLYMAAIAEQYLAAEQSGIPEKRRYLKLIRSRLRRVILGNLRTVFSCWPGNQWCLGVAFPGTMNVYWRVKAVLTRLRAAQR